MFPFVIILLRFEVLFSILTFHSHAFLCVLISFSIATQSVGLLSYTFLRMTGQDDVIVPMVMFSVLNILVAPSALYIFLQPPHNSQDFLLSGLVVLQIDFDISGHWAEPIIYASQDDWSSNLKTILEWSPFASKEDLLLQVRVNLSNLLNFHYL